MYAWGVHKEKDHHILSVKYYWYFFFLILDMFCQNLHIESRVGSDSAAYKQLLLKHGLFMQSDACVGDLFMRPGNRWSVFKARFRVHKGQIRAIQ